MPVVVGHGGHSSALRRVAARYGRRPRPGDACNEVFTQLTK